MKLVVDNNKIDLVGLEEHSNFAVMVSDLIDIYSGLTLARGAFLTEREKDFFICIVLFKQLGYSRCNDDIPTQVLNKYFGKHRPQEIYIYLKKLVEKSWIKVDIDRNIEIPQLFDSLNPDSGEINFSLSIKIDRTEEIL